MPAKDQELQTLSVQSLNVKSNLYGNLTIPPLGTNKTGENNPFLQKAKSLESGVHLSENGNPTDSQYNSMISIDSVNNNRNIGHHTSKITVDNRVINRYDSGYGSYVDFHSESSQRGSRDTLLEEPDQLNDIESINANNVSHQHVFYFIVISITCDELGF